MNTQQIVPGTESHFERGAVSVVNPQGTEETGTDRPAAPNPARARRPRKPSKKVQALIDAAREQAITETLERDRGAEMLGQLVWMAICFGAGAATVALWPW